MKNIYPPIKFFIKFSSLVGAGVLYYNRKSLSQNLEKYFSSLVEYYNEKLPNIKNLVIEDQKQDHEIPLEVSNI